MIIFTAVGVLVIILVAIINWKDSLTGRAKLLTRIVVFLWTLFFIFVVSPVVTFLQPFEHNLNNMLTVILILLLLLCLFMMAATYIPYLRNKSNDEIRQKTINESIGFCVSLIVVIVLFVYVIVSSQLTIVAA